MICNGKVLDVFKVTKTQDTDAFFHHNCSERRRHSFQEETNNYRMKREMCFLGTIYFKCMVYRNLQNSTERYKLIRRHIR